MQSKNGSNNLSRVHADGDEVPPPLQWHTGDYSSPGSAYFIYLHVHVLGGPMLC